MYIKIKSLIGDRVVWRQLINLKKDELPNMINPHRWLEHFPNQSSKSRICKGMSELSRVMEKHANTRKWRENHGGWVGNKRYQFPS